MNPRPDDNREAGLAIEHQLFGDKSEAIHELMAELDPDVGRWAREFAFGEVWTRDALSFEERLMVAIVSLAVLGRPDQLRNYLFGAVRAGIPLEKVQQALAMICIYAGFPAAVNALVLWREVLESAARH
jgi:4-carboxymuconolactone decarboxylase